LAQAIGNAHHGEKPEARTGMLAGRLGEAARGSGVPSSSDRPDVHASAGDDRETAVRKTTEPRRAHRIGSRYRRGKVSHPCDVRLPDDAPLTGGERHWLWRRRQRVSIAELARQTGISRSVIRQHEAGVTFDRRLDHRLKPTPQEVLRIARRRASDSKTTHPWSHHRVPAGIGVSHTYVARWESTCDPRLVAFWAARGAIVYACSSVDQYSHEP